MNLQNSQHDQQTQILQNIQQSQQNSNTENADNSETVDDLDDHDDDTIDGPDDTFEKVPDRKKLTMVGGIALKPKNRDIKKLVKKTNALNLAAQRLFCSKKIYLKNLIHDLDIPETNNKTCTEILDEIKKGLALAKKQAEDDLDVQNEDVEIFIEKTLDLASFLIPDILCEDNVFKVDSVKQLILDIIESVCDEDVIRV